MNKGRREGQGERANNNKEFSYVFVWCLFRSLIGPKSGQNPKKKKHPNLQPHKLVLFFVVVFCCCCCFSVAVMVEKRKREEGEEEEDTKKRKVEESKDKEEENEVEDEEEENKDKEEEEKVEEEEKKEKEKEKENFKKKLTSEEKKKTRKLIHELLKLMAEEGVHVNVRDDFDEDDDTDYYEEFPYDYGCYLMICEGLARSKAEKPSWDEFRLDNLPTDMDNEYLCYYLFSDRRTPQPGTDYGVVSIGGEGEYGEYYLCTDKYAPTFGMVYAVTTNCGRDGMIYDSFTSFLCDVYRFCVLFPTEYYHQIGMGSNGCLGWPSNIYQQCNSSPHGARLVQVEHKIGEAKWVEWDIEKGGIKGPHPVKYVEPDYSNYFEHLVPDGENIKG